MTFRAARGRRDFADVYTRSRLKACVAISAGPLPEATEDYARSIIGDRQGHQSPISLIIAVPMTPPPHIKLTAKRCQPPRHLSKLDVLPSKHQRRLCVPPLGR